MTITSGASLVEFDSAIIVITDPANASDPGFTVVGDCTNDLTPTDKVKLADAMLDITLSAAATAGDAVHLYRRDLNLLGSTNNTTFPSATFKNIYVGSFPLAPVATQQFILLTDIPISPDQQFAIEYDLTASSGTQTNGTVVKVRPQAYNVKA